MQQINLAEICPQTKTLGPGTRFALWVQGCCFKCPGCTSPDWIPQKEATRVDPIALAKLILSIPNIDGVTISGGEPTLQASALAEICEHIRSHRPNISIISYSGFTLKQLQDKDDEAIDRYLSLLDVLIDGQYIESLNDNKGFRGSSNQVVHFLSDRHKGEEWLFTQRPRDTELHLRDESALMVGVPPIGHSTNLKEVLQEVEARSNLVCTVDRPKIPVHWKNVNPIQRNYRHHAAEKLS